MRKPSRHMVVALILLLLAGLTWLATPKRYAHLSEEQLPQHVIPDTVGDWQVIDVLQPGDSNPELQERLDRLYSEIISRTYRNSHGQYLILLIAYGTVQDNINHVHRPEICYPAQGYKIPLLYKAQIDSAWGKLPVMRMEARKNDHTEWVTYWIRVGNDLTRGMLEQNWAQLKYGLTGQISDGLLFRVSMVQNDDSALITENQFINDLLGSIPPDDRRWLIGERNGEAASNP